LVGVPHVEDAEALQGFPRGWSDAATSAAKASYRWKLIGNAVPVDVVRWIGWQLRDPGVYNASGDRPLVSGTTWPDAAWGRDGSRFRAQVGHYPEDVQRASLATFLRHDLRPLSARAAAGFLARARKGNLRFPGGFLDSVERHITETAPA